MGVIGSGGPREGAGRKSIDGARVKISARLPAWLIDLVISEAERRQLSTSQLITELITKGLEK